MKKALEKVSGLAPFIFLFSFTQKELQPLSFLTEYKSLVLNRSNAKLTKQTDTLTEGQIRNLSQITFDSKDFEVEEYGVTPDETINLFHKGERVVLISIWHFDNKRVAVNINHIEQNKFYHGYVMDEDKFDSVMAFDGYDGIPHVDGLYKSNPNSFRSNFYVQIAGDSVTLYGWEIGLNKDTVYYRTNTVNDADTGRVNWKFENYEFSSTPISSGNIGGFTADTSINFFTGSLHKYFLGEFSAGMFKLIAVKAMYDSRADVFEFEKIQ